jgi:hypothetical protein
MTNQTYLHDTQPVPQNPGPNYAARWAGVLLAGAGVITAAAVGYTKAETAYDRHDRAEHNKAVFNKVETMSGNSFRIKSGATIRYSPDIFNDDGSTGTVGNAYEVVPEGQEVIAINPLEYKAGNQIWLGFTDIDTKSVGSKHGREVHTVWVDKTALESQSGAEGPYIVEVNNPNSNADTNVSTDIPISLELNGDIRNSDTGIIEDNAALSFQMPEHEVQQLINAGIGQQNTN